jgi:serine/tyrosine/threonine adenylyltransferase
MECTSFKIKLRGEVMTNKMDWNFNNSYADLPNSFYQVTKPTPVKDPRIVMLNEPLATKLGLDPIGLQDEENVRALAGNQLFNGSTPIAQAYAGHQFGHFTMLGDGRAILLGEHLTPKMERFDIQLKGSGITPYSRRGDGRATLGPMLREYLISEAMFALGIPTTRSLAVVNTGELITRETRLPGAILTRIASSHIRVGTFQYAANFTSVIELKKLADYSIKRHYPQAANETNPYLSFLKEVIKQQANLISKWQLVGFIHGVMNTDNMAISGETIDYGPCAFMDTYDLKTVFSSIDTQGRYAYGNQPYIAGWNLARFAETLLPLLSPNEEEAISLAQSALEDFYELYHDSYLNGMRQKLGLFNEEEHDETLIDGLLELMQKHKADYTNTFRALTLNALEPIDLFNEEAFKQWYSRYQNRLCKQNQTQTEVEALMKQSNPAVIPRNHRVEAALEQAVQNGDLSLFNELLSILYHPYGYTEKQVEYAQLPEKRMRYKTYCGT